jgi:hypothetical protein
MFGFISPLLKKAAEAFKQCKAALARTPAVIAKAAEAPEEPKTYKRTLPPIRRNFPKIGRNEICNCRWGRAHGVKYKHCCIEEHKARPSIVYTPAY